MASTMYKSYRLLMKVDDTDSNDYYIKSIAKHNHNVENKNNDCDSGFDLVMPYDVVIPPKTCGFKIDLGVRCEMTRNVVNTGKYTRNNMAYELRARSSISRTPLVLSNSIGTIDMGYRGTIMAAVNNFTNNPVTLNAGERYFQITLPSLKPFCVELTDKLSSTTRGEDGFGSTGK